MSNIIIIEQTPQDVAANIITEPTTYYLDVINTEKILVSDLPDNIPASKISGVVTSVTGNITFGSTTVALNGTSLVIDGLTRISGTSINSPTYLYNIYISGGTP